MYRIEIDNKEVIINRVYRCNIEQVKEEDLNKVIEILKKKCDEEREKEIMIKRKRFSLLGCVYN